MLFRLHATTTALQSLSFSTKQEVLLACALAPTDELEYFSSADIVKPLSAIMDRKYDIPAYIKHLNEFASEKRGPILILKKMGRRYRYRFVNPVDAASHNNSQVINEIADRGIYLDS